MSMPPRFTVGKLQFSFPYHPYLPSDPRSSDFMTIMCALLTKQYPVYLFFLNLMTMVNILGENLWRFRLSFFFPPLPFPYVFTHRSACTEQNLSQRYQPAMVLVNVTHIEHSGTVSYGTSRSHH
jgi:hypothetical protein